MAQVEVALVPRACRSGWIHGVTEGQVLFKGQDLIELSPEERAGEGVFLAFRYPVEIPGVANTIFLKRSDKFLFDRYRG